jgi:hypothetical protein
VDEAGLRAHVADLMPAVRHNVHALHHGYLQVRPHLDEVQRRAWTEPVAVHRHIGRPRA